MRRVHFHKRAGEGEAMVELQLTLLGHFQARLGQQRLDQFRSDKVRALLVYLAVEAERPHARGSLAMLLWPDQGEKSAGNNLSTTLSRLRDAIGDTDAERPFLLITRQSVQWNAAGAARLDIADFYRLARSTDIGDLERAAALYRGPFLHGFFVPGCQEFDEWLTVTREQTERVVLRVLDTLAHQYLAAQAYDAAEAAARRQLAIDAWRESAHRQVMQALVGAGQRNVALAQYAACRRVLAEQLGVEPEAATTALYQQIRSGELEPPASYPRGWDDTPDLGPFYGREHELATVTRWLLEDGCRVVGVVGLGGVGKTALAAQVVQRTAGRFDTVIWHSLLNAPPLAELLRTLLGSLSAHQATLPTTLSEQVEVLVEYLRRRRCLVVLDNLESILQGGEATLAYRAGYAEYGPLLLRLGQTRHQSCVVLTSREEPAELTKLAASANVQNGAVHILEVGGLEHAAALAILDQHGVASTDSAPLVHHYGGHPLALKLVADTIRDLYSGDIAAFLDQDTPIFADIRVVLDEQVARLTRLEHDILVWLAIVREPTTIATLQTTLLGMPGRGALLEAVHSLRRRSLLELHGDGLALQNVLIEYVTDRLIAQMCRELADGPCDWLTRFAVLQPGVKEYVRQSQARLIVQPIARRVAQNLGESGVRQRIAQLLDELRQTPRAPSYAAGNLLNLLLGLGYTLRGFDFSQLCVWQADLRNAEAQAVSFARADLAGTRFTDNFASITSVHFTPDGERLLAGCADGTLRLWRVRDGRPLGVFAGHAGVVWSVAISPDGRLCASGGDDQTVRVWNMDNGQMVHMLRGHSRTVQAVAFSPDGALLASGSQDHSINLWQLSSGQHIRTLRGHHGAVYAVAFAPTSVTPPVLASAGADLEIHIWDVSTARLVLTLSGHQRRVRCLAWSPDGASLLSSGHEAAPYIWDTSTWQPRGRLTGHTNIVPSLAFGADGATAVSGSFDTTVRLWNMHTGQVQRVLHGHLGWIHGVACSPDGITAASGGADQTTRIWDLRSGQELHTLAGHSTWIPALAFAPDGSTLISGHWDHSLRVWDLQNSEKQQTLRGHTNQVTSVACSPDGVRVASGSADTTVCVWNVQTGLRLLVLQGHTAAITSVAFHPLGQLLASSSQDGTVRVWDIGRGNLVQVLSGHTERVTAAAFSPDGRMLVSGSLDQTVRLWAVDGWQLIRTYESPAPGGRIWSLAFNHAGTCLAVGHYEGMIDLWDVVAGTVGRRLQRHTNIVESLAFSSDDATLVSGSDDSTICVWNVATGTHRQVWQGHAIRTLAVAFRPSPDDQGAAPVLASSGCDELIKVWNVTQGTCQQTLRTSGPYAGMVITGVTGLNQTQRLALTSLGALEDL